jgi:LysM domain/Transglycosylase-like domain
MTLSSIAASGAAKTLMAVTISLHPAVAKHESYVTVKSGDTLSSISQKVYGKSADWPAVWWANRHSVHNPSEIRVGQRLTLVSKSSVKKLVHEAQKAAEASDHAASAPAGTPEAPVAEPATTAYTGSGGFQSCVIAAESGGDASAVNPYSGAGGLYGFLPSTWQALGYSGLPEDASVAEQNAAFAKEYSESGGSAWSAYDGC